MSAPRPSTWMPFYVGDYLRDTQHLDAEKHGAYILLILSYWASGHPLPDDDEHLATVARLPLKRWRQIRPVIARFFGIENDEWRHKRVDIELEKAQHITNKRAAAGRASAQQRSSKRSTHVEQVHQQTEQQTGRPSPSPSQEEEDSEAIASAAVAAPATRSPLDLKRELWDTGKVFLGKQGIDRKHAGSLLGRWRRDHSDELVLAALAAAETECASDVVGFIEGFLRSRNGTGKKLGPATGIAQGFADALRAGEGQPDEDRRPH